MLYQRFKSKYYSIQKNSADSIQKIIQLKSQGIIDTGQIGKVPKNCPKSVKIRQKKGDFSSKMANFDSKYDSFIHFMIKFKRLFNINISGLFDLKDYSITFFFFWKNQFKNCN